MVAQLRQFLQEHSYSVEVVTIQGLVSDALRRRTGTSVCIA